MDPGVRRDDTAIVICLTGCFAIFLSTPVSKNIPLRVLVEAALLIPPSHPTEGRIAIVTDAGWNAVDADSARRDLSRGRMALLRTAKPCGPDAPTLASSWRIDPQTTVARKPGHRGEHEISR